MKYSWDDCSQVDETYIKQDRLKRILQETGLTQKEFAIILGYGVIKEKRSKDEIDDGSHDDGARYISNLLNGHKPINKKFTKRIEEKLGIRSDYLLGADPFKTQDDLIAYERPLAEAEADIMMWDRLISSIADQFGFQVTLHCIDPQPSKSGNTWEDFDMQCEFTDISGRKASISLSSLKAEFYNSVHETILENLE